MSGIAEGIGIAAGILAFVQVALEESKWLYKQFESIKSHKDIVATILRELNGLDGILTELNVYLQSLALGQDETRLRPVKTPLQDCAILLQGLTASLKRCNVEDPQSHRDNFKKWLKMQFKGKTMEEAYKYLQSQKATLTIALAFATLRDGTVTQDKLNELQSDISNYQADLTDTLDEIKASIATIADANKQELEGYKQSLEAVQQLLQAAAEVATDTKPANKIVFEDNKVDHGSRQLMGADSESTMLDLEARRNEASGHSVQMAGSFSKESIRAVLRSVSVATESMPREAARPAPEIAVALLQMRSAGGQRSSSGRIQPVEDDVGSDTLLDILSANTAGSVARTAVEDRRSDGSEASEARWKVPARASPS